MRPIDYIDYDKISDDVLYLGSKLYLRMNVSLSDKADPDIRYHFHREFMYKDTHAPHDNFISIKRKFNYYLSLDRTDISQGGIMIRAQDMILLKSKLEQVSVWFTGNTFGTKDKQLVIRYKKDPVILDGLAQQKYIQFNPIVVVYDSTGEQSPGVRITLGDPDIFADITVDKFYGLKYTIDNFNLYQSAQLLINYLGRPEYGFNMSIMEDNKFLENEGDVDIANIKNRNLPNQKKKSYFEKMDDMMKGDE